MSRDACADYTQPVDRIECSTRWERCSFSTCRPGSMWSIAVPSLADLAASLVERWSRLSIACTNLLTLSV